jgi:peptidoglycan/LPS O-acetylase OafA/YrhL
VFDGLRGIAIVLVVVSHGWTIWPAEVYREPGLRTLFSSGNFAVSLFFAVGAYAATTALLRRARSPQDLHPLVDAIRRYLRLTGQVALLLLAILLVSVFDDTDPNSDETTRVSVVRILTYTWNWYLQQNPGNARADLGHLWYLSVYFQAMVLVTVLVWLFRRRPIWLVPILLALVLATEAWTRHITFGVADDRLLYQAELRTSVRIDAPLAGALAAVLTTYAARLRPYAATIGTCGFLALFPLAYLCTPNTGYFGFPGMLTDVALMAFVMGVGLAAPPAPVRRVLGWRPLTFLGANSLGLYLWHYPVFWFAARHFYDWAWGWRTAAALALTLACALVSELVVERRVKRALAAPGWHELDYGLPAYLRRRWRARTSRRAGPSEAPTGPAAEVSASDAAAGRPG